ncbi:hypothetical protein INT43_001177 [Umbelopsis isabellina]|uniref:Uncharacterized protein n=1 Tax=Mortierella isabellina TaxID=91625 RepID=A0A8H7PKT3_MORIS|nr:hypothetical protein INT43_001177 [Umbelopsis isabellina]
MERSRYPIPQKNQIKITKRYLRESESGRYDELDEETVRPSRKGRVTTSHEPNFDYKRSNGNTRAHVAEYQDHIHYKRSGSRADSGYLEKSKEKPILDLNDQHIIYKERSREFKVDPSVKVAFEKPKKVHFQMRESKSTPPSVRVKAIKQKHGSNPTKYYTPSSYQQKQKYEKYGEHILDLEDGILSNDEGFKYSKHSNAKSLDYPRLHNDQYRRKASSYSQHPVDFSDSDNPSGSESDLEFYNRPYRSRRPQKFGKYSLYTSVPNNQVNDYNHIPSRIPRPASGMSGPQKSALKKSSSFNSRDKFSISKASRLNNILNNENLKNTNERKSVLLERPSSGKTMRSQVKNNRRYTPSTPGSPKKSVKYKPLMEDFESESSDGSSTDDSEPVEHKHGPSRTRKGSPATHENCYSVETSDSDSDEAFEQIEVYVPTAVFKHPPRQVYDHDQGMRIAKKNAEQIHEMAVKANQQITL